MKTRTEIGEKIDIEEWEVRRAMKQLSKDKASSVDGVPDLIFKEKELLEIF